MSTVAQQMQTTWEKKKRENETKFIEIAKTDLRYSGSASAKVFASEVQRMNAIYDDFLLEYAGICDEIRKTMVAISDENQAFLCMLQEKINKIAESDKEREKGQIQSMAMAKKAVEDATRLIESLEP
ncbi:hypothetical protein K474DRAFT_1706496 [Panus rudis PR-1116 ss-1]|nr:hypothetical protein K474DRAFT_1706496 [Panus rudis PR-1116 ss-1]